MPKPISVTEAGRRGGKATAAKLTPAQRKAAWRHAASKPRPGAWKFPRCPCGARTLHSARMRKFDCCKRAGVSAPLLEGIQ